MKYRIILLQIGLLMTCSPFGGFPRLLGQSHRTSLQIADSLQSVGLYNQSVLIYDSILARLGKEQMLRTDSAWSENYLFVLNQRISANIRLSNWDSIQSDISQAMLVIQAKRDSSDRRVIEHIERRAYFHGKLAEAQQSYHYLSLARKLAHKYLEPNDSLRTYIEDNYITALANSRRYEEADSLLSDRLDMILNHHSIDTLRLANMYYRRSKLDQKLRKYKESLESAELAEKTFKTDRSLSHLVKSDRLSSVYETMAETHLSLGEYDKAITYSLMAEKQHHMAYKPDEITAACMRLRAAALIRRWLPKDRMHSKALIDSIFQIRIQLFGNNPYHRQIARTYKLRGTWYYLSRKMEKAEDDFQIVVNYHLQNEPKDSSSLGFALRLLGSAQTHKEHKGNKREIGIRHLDQALQVFLHLGDTIEVLNTFNQIGIGYNMGFQPEKAVVHIQKGLNYLSGIKKDTLNFSENPPLSAVLKWKNICLKMLSNKSGMLGWWSDRDTTKDHLAAIYSTLKVAEAIILATFHHPSSQGTLRAYQVGITRNVYPNMMVAAYRLYERDQDEKYLEELFRTSEYSKANFVRKALLTEDHLKKAGIPHSLIDEERRLSKKILQLDAGSYAGINEQEQRSIIEQKLSLLRSLDSLYQIMRKDYPSYVNFQSESQIPGLDEIQAKLSTNTVLIEYFWVNNNLIAMTIEQQNVRVYFLEQENLNSIIREEKKRWNHFAMDQTESTDQFDSFIQLHHHLYRILLEPLVADFNDQIDDLVIIPHGEIEYVPFELLLETKPDSNSIEVRRRDYRKLSYLLKKYSISYSHSATLWAWDALRPLSSQVYGGFAPIYYGDQLTSSRAVRKYASDGQYDLQPLAYNRQEAEELEQLLGGRTYLGEEATKEAFVRYADRYQILHLPMHSIADPNDPEQFSLVFSHNQEEDDFQLLSVEELYSMDLNAEMAVLSACHTGGGTVQQGEGIISLSHGFTMAGCRNVLMSRWAVDDKSTYNIMSDFFINLKTGMTKAEALRQAKFSYLRNASNKHPYYWAAYGLIQNYKEMAIMEKSQKESYLFRSILLLIVLVLLGWTLFRRP